MIIYFKKLEGFKGDLPKYATTGAAGMDVRACLSKDIELQPGERVIVPTRLAVWLPPGVEMQVRPRSGLAAKFGVTVLNSPGTIDCDYRGEIGVILINHGERTFMVEDQARIAQLVVAPYSTCDVCEIDNLDDTARGAGGFGSTGVKS